MHPASRRAALEPGPFRQKLGWRRAEGAGRLPERSPRGLRGAHPGTEAVTLTTPPRDAARLAALRARAAHERDPQARAAAFVRLYPLGPWKTPLRAWEFRLPGERRTRGRRAR